VNSVTTEEVLDLIKLYRHDLMNDLQLIQGYASMGKFDQSNEKLKQFIHKLNIERQLQTLDAPEFIFWLLKLKLFERDIQFTMSVDMSQEPISAYDEKMKNDGEVLLHFLKENSSKNMSVIPLHIEIFYEDGWNIKYVISKALNEILDVLKDRDYFFQGTENNDELNLVFKYK